MVEPKSTEITLTIAGQEICVQQSPTRLTANRKEGTTGAVLWKVTQFVAEWLRRPCNPLFANGILNSRSTVLELGSGIAGLIALAVAAQVGSYVLSDQEHVLRPLEMNIERNLAMTHQVRPKHSKDRQKGSLGSTGISGSNIRTFKLDWETDSMSNLNAALGLGSQSMGDGVDCIIASDCIFNYHLIEPFITTCVEICRLQTNITRSGRTLVLIAQQLRSHEIFTLYLASMLRYFHVYDITKTGGTDNFHDLAGPGYSLHLAFLRNENS